MRKRLLLAGVWACLSAIALAKADGLGSAAAQVSGFDRIDQVVADAIKAKQTPGAVVLIGKGDQIVYEKAYGLRAVIPTEEPMTIDTVFDLASLTKVIATNTAMMTLIEQGRV